MTWQLLEEFQPTWEWQLTEQPLIGEVAIKVEQDWAYAGSFPGKAHCHLVQQFPEGALYNFRRLYPYRDPRIISTVIPDDLKAAGWNVYQLALKLNLYARFQDDANWRVRLYRWTSSEPPALTTFPTNAANSPSIPDLVYDGGLSNS